jgi:predicted ATPase/transcriptional regulator with XRE-family HTH domain
MPPDSTFGALLRRHRIAASLTQEALAERAGLSVRGISDLERGVNTQPRLETVRLLAEALDLSETDRSHLALRARPETTAQAPHAIPDRDTAAVPIPLTPLLGRESAVATIGTMVQQPQTRLVTLTGPGGIGKTRLAQAVAIQIAAEFADGARFIPLATVADPALVAETVAYALGVQESGGPSLHQRLIEYLHPRQLLLVLDNFEHLLASAPFITDLLGACPALTVLVTCRAALRLSGEQEWLVPPLALPDTAQAADPQTLMRAPAVALFVRRAQAVDPGFQPTAAEAPAIAALCAALDGLPLAIELAAARVKILPPQAMLARMTQPLQVLVGGPRDQPVRHQTLRDTIAWSYDLLTPGEQALFACLTIFVGSWTLAAAEAVSPAIGGDTGMALDALSALVDHHLIRQAGEVAGELRFGMLETIREYARERLVASGREAEVAEGHARYFLAYVEWLRPAIYGTKQETGPNQEEAMAILEAEHDNLRAALAWALAAGEGELALRLGIAVKKFWQVRGYLAEGRRWLTAALAQATDVPPLLRVQAIDMVSYLMRLQGDYASARALAEEGLVIVRALQGEGDAATAGLPFSLTQQGIRASDEGDDYVSQCQVWLGSILFNLGMTAQDQHADAEARAYYEESLALFRPLDDTHRIGFLLLCLGELAQRAGAYDDARNDYEESLRLLRESGDTQGMIYPLNDLGVLARDVGDHAAARTYLTEGVAIRRALTAGPGLAQSLDSLATLERDVGHYAEARALHEESLALSQTAGDRPGIVRSLTGLAVMHLRAGDTAAAGVQCEAGLRMADELGDKQGIAACLSVLAEMSGVQGKVLRAAQLWAAATALRAAVGVQLPPVDRAHEERSISAAQAGCSESTWNAAWQAGWTMPVEQAVRVAFRKD